MLWTTYLEIQLFQLFFPPMKTFFTSGKQIKMISLMKSMARIVHWRSKHRKYHWINGMYKKV